MSKFLKRNVFTIIVLYSLEQIKIMNENKLVMFIKSTFKYLLLKLKHFFVLFVFFNEITIILLLKRIAAANCYIALDNFRYF